MSEISGVFETSFANWLFDKNYDWADGTYKTYENADIDDRAVATIREYLYGDIARVRLSAQSANVMVSTVQTFEAAAAIIVNKLTEMQTLAEKVVEGKYFDIKGKTSIHNQLKDLGQDINSIVQDTEYDKNKLFTSEGTVISTAIGDDRTIKLFAMDLTFDVKKADLTTDAEAAVVYIKDAKEQAGEYSQYIHNQLELLESAMATIELEIAIAAGIETSDFSPKAAEKLVSQLAHQISGDSGKASAAYSEPSSSLATILLS